MKYNILFFLLLSLNFTFTAKAQSEFEEFQMFDIREMTSLSFSQDPFSVATIGRTFNLPEVDIFKDKFSVRPKINMVEAAQRKSFQAQQKQEQEFSFIERQTAMFNAFKPKINNNNSSPWAPNYNNQTIYSDLNRVKNSVYEDLGDKYRRMSPFFQGSPFRSRQGDGVFFRVNRY
ncbi:hypothetical protein [Psychroflexus aestuariivivens]|uniref:hypothetical protein n=1 Tax=Psychroflexus aestuariivivens TaxID=1795040 RepID=UPI000FDC8C29|nr:hypothetical protein [Psychroflexus aestuariivivens]